MDSWWKDSKVLITGHTGFKGAWLSEWLQVLGADVCGIGLEPDYDNSLYELLNHKERLSQSHIQDIRDLEKVSKIIEKIEPDFVFHMAAQALVRRSYKEPIYTYETNVLGTAHILESLRRLNKPCISIFVTTDKCYKNQEWEYGYRENDILGGLDPYSSSKACCEILINSFRESFFSEKQIFISSARAGNVIGGGDWAEDRIIPDCIRALYNKENILIRNMNSVRPWQHVLDALSGYICLANEMHDAYPSNMSKMYELSTAFNFGPDDSSNRTVEDLVKKIIALWPGEYSDASNPNDVHETFLLKLCTDKAKLRLNWKPTWDFERSISETISWYKNYLEKKMTPIELTQMQIGKYISECTFI